MIEIEFDYIIILSYTVDVKLIFNNSYYNTIFAAIMEIV